MTAILGATGPVEEYRAVADEQTGANALFLDEMLPALHRAALAYGIKASILIGQSGHETGWGNFGRAVTPEHHNTCGLKVRNPVGPDTNPDDHMRFATWDEGATAHAQHLYAYMGKPLPAGAVNIDPRWVWVYGKHAVTDVEELGGKWAPSPTYGNLVAAAAARFAHLDVAAAPPATLEGILSAVTNLTARLEQKGVI